MKRVLLLAAVLALSGCDGLPTITPNGEIGFQTTDPKWLSCGFTPSQGRYLEKNGLNNPFEGKEWFDAGISDPEKIIQWRNAAFTPELAQKFIKAGITNPPEAFALADAINARNNPDELDESTIRVYAQAVGNGEVTIQNISDAVHHSGVGRSNAPYIVSIASKIGRGMSATQAASSFKKEKEAQYTSNFISTYGRDIYKECGTNIPQVMVAFGQIDPYEVAGKCYTLGVSSYNNNIQWIGEDELLIPQYPILILGDEHIRIGHDFIAMGQQPKQYRSVLGAIQTPATFKVLKYIN